MKVQLLVELLVAMKLKVILVLIIFAFHRQCASRFIMNSHGIRTVVSDIVRSLARNKHVVTVFTSNEMSEAILFASASNVPHITSRTPDEHFKFKLKTSAIISMDSIASLESFNNYVGLDLKFSLQQVVVVLI